LMRAGYEHYETSAFALPERRCRHNLNYWRFGDYLGIGAGAHSKLSLGDRIVRQVRHKHPRAYLEGVARANPIQEAYEIRAADVPLEFMMNALRLNDGVESALFAERTGVPLTSVIRALEAARCRGLLESDPLRLRPTPQGRRFLNDLLQLFLPEDATGGCATRRGG
ncbi:MAG: radical SAM family heme chaperone HemW, partial [Burkholderiales bacterium]